MKTFSIQPTKLILVLCAAGVIGGAGTTFVLGTHVFAATPPISTQPSEATNAALGVPATAIGAPDFSQITERYGAAVVNISVSGMQETANNSDSAHAEQGRGI